MRKGRVVLMFCGSCQRWQERVACSDPECPEAELGEKKKPHYHCDECGKLLDYAPCPPPKPAEDEN